MHVSARLAIEEELIPALAALVAGGAVLAYEFRAGLGGQWL